MNKPSKADDQNVVNIKYFQVSIKLQILLDIHCQMLELQLQLKFFVYYFFICNDL